MALSPEGERGGKGEEEHNNKLQCSVQYSTHETKVQLSRLPHYQGTREKRRRRGSIGKNTARDKVTREKGGVEGNQCMCFWRRSLPEEQTVSA